MIISFGNKTTADLFNGIDSRESRKIPSEITKTALKKLDIRINSQWRIIFQWDNSNVSQVEIIDYHN